MSLDSVVRGTGRVLRTAGRGTAIAGRFMAREYRRILDPYKPTLDRIIDPLAVVLATNAGISAGVYLTQNKLIEPAIPSIASFVDHHDYLEAGIKVAAYTAIYAGLNLGGYPPLTRMHRWGILPTALHISRRRTRPSRLNHATTGLILLAFGGAYILGHVRQDHLSIKTIDDHLSGSRTAEISAKVQDGVESSIESIENALHVMGIYNPSKDTQQVEDENTTIRSARTEQRQLRSDFPYTDKVSKAAQDITRRGIPMTPEELVYITRVVYFEGSFDKKAGHDLTKIRKGMDGVSHVMRNRWEYDRNHQGKRKVFSKQGQDDPFDVVFRSDRVTRTRKGGRQVTYTLWQFTCIRDQQTYFYEHKGKGQWDMYAGGDLRYAVGNMNRPRADLAYQAVVDAFLGRTADPTNGSLFYKNPRASDRYNQDWERRGLERRAVINSHQFYTFGNRCKRTHRP
jgi:hypothetical protein